MRRLEVTSSLYGYFLVPVKVYYFRCQTVATWNSSSACYYSCLQKKSVHHNYILTNYIKPNPMGLYHAKSFEYLRTQGSFCDAISILVWYNTCPSNNWPYIVSPLCCYFHFELYVFAFRIRFSMTFSLSSTTPQLYGIIQKYRFLSLDLFWGGYNHFRGYAYLISWQI